MTRQKKSGDIAVFKKIRFGKVINIIFLTVSALWPFHIAIIQRKTATLKLPFLSHIVLWKESECGNDSKWVLDQRQQLIFKKMAMLHLFAVFVTLKNISFFFMLKTLLMQQILCKGLLPVFLPIFALWFFSARKPCC